MLLLACIVGFLGSWAQGARILGVFPFPSYSHQVVFRALTSELSRRGHDVTTFTTDPVNDPTLVNLTEVDLSSFYNTYRISSNFLSKSSSTVWMFLRYVGIFSETLSDNVLSHPEMRRLMRSNSTEKFDLIIVQCVYNDALYALGTVFNAPMIGISSLPTLPSQMYTFGNPLEAAYSPHVLLGHTDDMNFWQRIENLYFYLREIWQHRYFAMPLQDKVVKKHFGDSMPSVATLASNLSMLFVNVHPFHTYPRSMIPGILMIGGLRMTNRQKPLPEDLKKILDDSKEGFIYFSMGTNVKSEFLPRESLVSLLSVFGQLPYKVIWKYDAAADLPNKPDNVVVRKWLPQEQILSHPNARLFMYQGGLQSTEEAIQHGIPLIGFPIFSDQNFNVNQLLRLGLVKAFDIVTFDRTALKDAIMEIASNSSYKASMLRYRDLLVDTPEDALTRAVWWTEHVIRHKGAEHLRNRSRDMHWYKAVMLDVFAFFLALAVLAIYATIVALRSSQKVWLAGVRFYEDNIKSAEKKKLS